jgi:hypothetical protein
MSRTLALVIVAAFAASCTQLPYKPYAREVKKKPSVSGVIALKPDHVPEDRTYADSLMKRNCGENAITIAEEGEVEIGQKTVSNETQTKEDREDMNWNGVKFYNPAEKNTSKTSSVESIKEWHINYNCSSVATTEVPKKVTAPKKK